MRISLAMRSAMIVAGLLGLSACLAARTPVIYGDSGWRTATGAPLSIAEVEALSHSCAPRRVVAAIDSDRPVASLLRDNPAYHPGAQGLANAPPTGIAAAGQPIEPGTRIAAAPGAGTVEACLYGKGLVRAR
jgi:hypothetical protein